jgi:hypothetical protein
MYDRDDVYANNALSFYKQQRTVEQKAASHITHICQSQPIRRVTKGN